MKKKVIIYLKPIVKYINIADDLTEIEEEMEITRQIFDVLEDEIVSEAEIDYWEECDNK